MLQGVSNRCSPHSTGGQTEARAAEVTVLQVRSRGCYPGLPMARLIHATDPRRPRDAQNWAISPTCRHPHPSLTKKPCGCQLLVPPSDRTVQRNGAGGGQA